jgi:hypothetical protein
LKRWRLILDEKMRVDMNEYYCLIVVVMKIGFMFVTVENC